jgi:hypothetical protein
VVNARTGTDNDLELGPRPNPAGTLQPDGGTGSATRRTETDGAAATAIETANAGSETATPLKRTTDTGVTTVNAKSG